jgi:hypothetical protein
VDEIRDEDSDEDEADEQDQPEGDDVAAAQDTGRAMKWLLTEVWVKPTRMATRPD